jgi:hypothetical protein
VICSVPLAGKYWKFLRTTLSASHHSNPLLRTSITRPAIKGLQSLYPPRSQRVLFKLDDSPPKPSQPPISLHMLGSELVGIGGLDAAVTLSMTLPAVLSFVGSLRPFILVGFKSSPFPPQTALFSSWVNLLTSHLNCSPMIQNHELQSSDVV